MHYVKLKGAIQSPMCSYVYIDWKRNYADQIFINNKITVTFEREYKHESGYKAIFVSFAKEDEAKFLKSMSELKAKVNSVRKDYDKICAFLTKASCIN